MELLSSVTNHNDLKKNNCSSVLCSKLVLSNVVARNISPSCTSGGAKEYVLGARKWQTENEGWG